MPGDLLNPRVCPIPQTAIAFQRLSVQTLLLVIPNAWRKEWCWPLIIRAGLILFVIIISIDEMTRG